MPRGIYPRAPRTSERLRDVATCRKCAWAWKPSSGFISEPCPNCGQGKDVRDRKGKYVTPTRFKQMQEYRAKQPGYSTKGTRRARTTALLLVGRGTIRCVRCGCDRQELIEINHKHGGGAKEVKGKGSRMVRDIALLRRPVDDLELLCKPCNAVHALELKHGPLPFQIQWGNGK